MGAWEPLLEAFGPGSARGNGAGTGGAMAAGKPRGFAPNAFVRIDSDGTVRVLVPRSEMGQGVLTALALIVAEELEADWSAVRAEHAPAAPEYQDANGLQSTDGSTSVRESWEGLRRAGAVAREMLVAAAGARWGVDPAGCRAEAGKVVHAASGREATFGALVDAAAARKPPARVRLKDRREFRLVGKPTRRLDAAVKTDGSATFGIDVVVPGMLVARVLRCPVFGGRLAGFDGKAALRIPGVRHVVPLPAGVGVVADTFWTAGMGLEALRVRWDEGPLAELFTRDIDIRLANAARRPGTVARRDGDALGALRKAERARAGAGKATGHAAGQVPGQAAGQATGNAAGHVTGHAAGQATGRAAGQAISASYRTPYLAHATMEPMNCVAHVRKGRCEVWAPTQNPGETQAEAARLTKLPLSKVDVHVPYLGGGFGRRSETDFVTEAVLLSKAIGRPVKVVWSREDDFRHDFYRPASYHRVRGCLDSAGWPAAIYHRVVSPSVNARWGPLPGNMDENAVEGVADVPYALPHYRVEYTSVDPGVPVGYWRSVGFSQNAFAIECFVDELAAAGGKDPVAVRRRLLGGHPRMRAVLEAAAKAARWGRPLSPGHAQGVALCASYGSYVAQVAEVSLAGAAPRVHRVWCAIDCGTVINPQTVVAQMEGSIAFGLSAALYGNITIERGRVAQTGFGDHPVLRISEMPQVEVVIVPSDAPPGGVGEPGVPPIAPAVANALRALTGRPIRRLPIAPA